MADISRVQAGRARRLVPSAALLNTAAARRGFGPTCFGVVVCLCVLIDLPRRGWRRAWRNESPNRSGIEKPRSPGRA